MSYYDYYLKFDSEEQAREMLFQEDTPRYTAIDLIGDVYKFTGTFIETEEGSFPETQKVPGYHVNVRHQELAPELDAFSVVVATPVRVWA